MGFIYLGHHKDGHFLRVDLSTVASLVETHAMDSLVSYKYSSSNNADGEAWTEGQPPSKKRSIEQLPVLVILNSDEESDDRESEEERGRDNIIWPFPLQRILTLPRMEAEHSVQRAFIPQTQISQTKVTCEKGTANWNPKSRETVKICQLPRYVKESGIRMHL